MPRQRALWIDRLKTECVQEYIRLHQEVWPELEAAYRLAGITQLGCYLNGCERVVFIEYDMATYDQAKARLDNDPVEIRWQAMMKDLCDPGADRQRLTEVYFLTSKPLE